MEQQQIQALTATFEGHAQQTVSKAKTACDVTGHAASDHFPGVGKMIELGLSGAKVAEKPGYTGRWEHCR